MTALVGVPQERHRHVRESDYLQNRKQDSNCAITHVQAFASGAELVGRRFIEEISASVKVSDGSLSYIYAKMEVEDWEPQPETSSRQRRNVQRITIDRRQGLVASSTSQRSQGA